MMISKKVILLGKYGVGKTSLIRQYVYSQFSEEYLTTIGVKIDKKILEINGVTINLLIWDIAGESAQVKVPATYKMGAHAIIYVFDVTRPATYEHLKEEVEQLNSDLPRVPMWVVGNKSDLLLENEVEEVKTQVPVKTDFMTSAKMATHVADLFMKVAEHFVNHVK